MENVKFVCSRKGSIPYTMEYVFKLSSNIAGLIRDYTNIPKNRLQMEISNDNDVILRTGSRLKKEYVEIDEGVIKKIETISNSVDEETFWNHLLTNRGKLRYPADIHNLMKTEFGLTDEEGEWWIAHFFIKLSTILFSPFD